MEQQIIPTTSTITFVVRFWNEITAGGVRRRGRIQHVQSGESEAFLKLDEMLSFLLRFGIQAGDRGQKKQDEE